ncbi:MAG: VapC toxin family PIN domain ribonuclease [Acidobacteria bacterium]|nr:MAG: VapC toxin family PIN domain ribonuclease [Acidobacteriota bacterium]PYV86781.1 MAG: VapC toxin family PIN domain ribonuclease [Acidobacteriota bacterium]
MIVLDASAAIEWLLQTIAGRQIEKHIVMHHESLHAPHLLDLEVAQVLRRLERNGVITVRRAEEAMQDLSDLRINRYPHHSLLPRIWELHQNLSAYDAAYVALAEVLDAAMLTRDARIGSAFGHSARIEVF